MIDNQSSANNSRNETRGKTRFSCGGLWATAQFAVPPRLCDIRGCVVSQSQSLLGRRLKKYY